MPANAVKLQLSQRFHFHPAPPLSQPQPSLPRSQEESYAAAFVVKVLGIGAVLHRSDYGGCQKVLDSLAARKRKRKSRVILTITPRHFTITSKKNGRLMLVHKMEDVYVCHPHSSNKRLFGFISESWESKRKHCFCFSTFRSDDVTGTDVLRAYTEACRLWTIRSESSKDENKEVPHQQEEDGTGDKKKNPGLKQTEEEHSTSDKPPKERGSTKRAHAPTRPKTLQTQRQHPDSKSSRSPIQPAARSESGSKRRVSFEPFVQRHGGIGGRYACSCSIPLKGAHTCTGSSSWVKVMPQVADRVGGGRNVSLSREARKAEKRRKELKKRTIKVKIVRCETTTNGGEAVGTRKAVNPIQPAACSESGPKRRVSFQPFVQRHGGIGVVPIEGSGAAGTDKARNHEETTLSYRETAMAAKLQKPAKTRGARRPTANHRAPLLAPRNFPPPPPPIPPSRPSPELVVSIHHRHSNPPSLLGSRGQPHPALTSTFTRSAKNAAQRLTSSSGAMKFPMQLLHRFISELRIATATAK